MLQDKFEKFLAMFADAVEKGCEMPDYLLICRRLRVSPADLDEILEEELGITGAELLRLPSSFCKFADYLGKLQLKQNKTQ